MDQIARALSLDQIGPGESVVLRELGNGRELQRRLMLLGLFAGARVDVLQRRLRGPMLIRVRSTLVAIGYEEARSIRVDRVK